jgi:hypothetical protein
VTVSGPWLRTTGCGRRDVTQEGTLGLGKTKHAGHTKTQKQTMGEARLRERPIHESEGWRARYVLKEELEKRGGCVTFQGFG